MEALNEKTAKAESPKLIVVPLKKWPVHFEYPTVGTLKGLCLRRRENGFNICVKMIHGRIYLDVDETLKFFRDQKEI